MLPNTQVFANQIKGIINENPYSPADNPEDAEKAVNHFCNELAGLLLNMLKTQAEVIHTPGTIVTSVTTSGGNGSGVNLNPIKGKLQ